MYSDTSPNKVKEYSLHVFDDSNELISLNFDVIRGTVKHRNISNSLFVWLNQVGSSSDIRIDNRSLFHFM